MADYVKIIENQKEDLDELLKADVLVRERMSNIDLNSPCAQVVIGMRRSGKSILCLTAFKSAGIPFGFVNFDDENLDGIEASDLDEILKAVYVVYGPVKHLFLDRVSDGVRFGLDLIHVLFKLSEVLDLLNHFCLCHCFVLPSGCVCCSFNCLYDST